MTPTEFDRFINIDLVFGLPGKLVPFIMAHVYQLLCPAEAKKFFILIGATVAVVLVFQYFEFPSTRVFSSFFSVRNTSSFTSGSSINQETLGDLRHSSGLNSTDTGEHLQTSYNKEKISKETESDNSVGVPVPNSVISPDISKKDVDSTSAKHESLDGSPAFPRALTPAVSLNNVDAMSVEIGSSGEGLSFPPFALPPEFNNDDPASAINSKATAFLLLPPEVAFENVDSVSGINGISEGNLAFPPDALPPIDGLANKNFPTDVNSSTRSVNKDAAGAYGKDRYSSLPSSSSGRTSRISAMKRKRPKRAPKRVFSISQMNNLLRQSLASSRSVRTKWPSEVDKELQFAKSEIQKAPNIESDTELYGPLYRNISVFKRSYELMEKMLKVYIYKEGEKPIFHQPVLNGIYASEGWFMKLMESSENIVTKEARKAHLFYFPFSSRLLELTLYVPKSHNRKNLIQYMKNYVDMMAAKYPFWNRTGGADHFLAACHDWAPAETRGRILSCIRALCNADVEVGFRIGKDVSLPETYVPSSGNQLKNSEEHFPSERHILAFFAGSMHGYLRPILLEYWLNKEPDMKIFGPMPRVKGNTNYIEYMKSSKFCICPRGHEVNSPRIVEAITYECVPVIISDNYVPPFFEILNWESFAVFVLEKDIPNLKNMLLSISDERYKEMQKRVKEVRRHFLWHSKPVKYDLFHMILHSVWYNRVFQMNIS